MSFGCEFGFHNNDPEFYRIPPEGEESWRQIFKGTVSEAIVKQVPFELFKELVPGGIDPSNTAPALIETILVDPGTCYPATLRVTLYEEVKSDGRLRPLASAIASARWLEEGGLRIVNPYYEGERRTFSGWQAFLNKLGDYLAEHPQMDCRVPSDIRIID